MQSIAVASLCLFFLTSVVANSYHTSAKLRRDGVLNLYPFPRVGRASHTWQLPIKEKLPSQSVLDPESTKRQLYAFPRVGRDMSVEDLYHYIKRQSLEPQSKEVGMWFGPRLGRAYHADDIEMTDEAERGEQLEQNLTEREKRNAKEI
ncbi:unnamed protein product [Danaus chrysippus]|uniref:(African queen) hypothetical protein n=1 Tax=Danaus chrysippus TaxID=151541 RepID=A0A8J2R6N0_9NEOP|nr:unnamed protein product [Danaus chrysippus]